MSWFGSAFSIVGSILAALCAWLLANLAGKQIVAYWELKKEIARCLVLYANADSVSQSDDPLVREAHQKFRDLASSVVGVANSIPFYNAYAFIRLVPSKENMEIAKSNLIGLSNGLGVANRQLENSRRYGNITKALSIVI